jgi:two-component system NtrC family sensor kinase
MAERGRKAKDRAPATKLKKPVLKSRSGTTTSTKPKSIKSKSIKPKSTASKSPASRSSKPANSRSETARLKSELRAARDRQAASAEVIRLISASPGDADQTLRRIAEITERLFDASSVTLLIADGERWGQTIRVGAGSERITTAIPLAHVAITPQFMPGAVYLENRQVHVPNIDDPVARARWPGLTPARAAGSRTMSGTPLRCEGRAVGALIVHRARLVPFTEDELALLQSFADQAAIAIENARLFNETREALERQTATADILKVIASSPSDVQPVFEAIAASSNRLIGGFSTAVLRFVDEELHLAAFTPIGPEKDEALKGTFPAPLSEFPLFRVVRGGETQQFTDTESQAVPPQLRDLARLRGYRSMLFTPLMSGDKPIGMISVTRETPGTFAAHYVQLVRTFADQAVIAIENVRLFDEVKARTADLTEALQQQTATSDVLKVISRSVFDLQTVLDTLVESAYKLCGANLGLLYLRGDEAFECKAIAGAGVEPASRLFKGRPIRAGRGTAAERVILTGEVQSITDFYTDPEMDPKIRESIRNASSSIAQIRSTLAVPMTRDNAVIGVMVIACAQTGPFPTRQIELLRTFADQAVIAIENARLFDEVQAKTADLSEALTYQTGSSNILKVIASSPTDVGPVLRAIVESACELCEADDALAVLREGDDIVCMEQHGSIPVLWKRMPANRDSAAGRAVVDRKTVHVHDLLSTEGEQFPNAQEFARRTNVRTILSVPMLRDNEGIGSIVLRRTKVQPFGDKQIALLQTFADQAVIALGNVRLFEQVQQRTRELSQSLDELRTAQDRLVQTEKLASLGQLTAGIAHEIKNPLNFVNNFSALSAELIDELNDVLKPATLDGKVREEIDELTQLLKGNLEKVVQHGKRADSIVKNMLLHSREGSGEQRSVDINAILDESLNLAYHGARAEKPGFNITLQRDFDAGVATIDAFPQEITRVFLNLITNGFYAAAKRKSQTGDSGFEPVLRATTRNIGHAVEIRIRDNGTGIPADVKDKIFNPFFTTKPAGEGTGLGLSMSHDIIVKQHGGSIDVTTEPGQFTEFTIVLPRTSNFSNKN